MHTNNRTNSSPNSLHYKPHKSINLIHWVQQLSTTSLYRETHRHTKQTTPSLLYWNNRIYLEENWRRPTSMNNAHTHTGYIEPRGTTLCYVYVLKPTLHSWSCWATQGLCWTVVDQSQRAWIHQREAVPTLISIQSTLPLPQASLVKTVCKHTQKPSKCPSAFGNWRLPTWGL